MLPKSLALLIASGLTVQATQLFNNTGTTAGWDAIFIDSGSKGTVQQVTNVVYQGPSALKMTQTYDSSYTGRYHSEVHHYNAMKKGDTGFYGFAFRLEADWQSSPAQSYNIAQFIADFTDLDCGEDYMPGTMVEILGDQLVTRRKYGSVCPTSSQQTEYYNNLATITPGVWHKVEIQASWQSDSSGFLKLWLDGNKVLEELNVATSVTDGRAFEFRVGLYANGWHDDKELKGTQPTRQVWFDEIGLGTAFADADPDQW
ncbi:hypothetical protein LSUB1_G007201 [Lachnellula subtilissima]|uniref:Polysaccharide lyase family 20 protein n=1 Tax=Lachnellula subtilissima TaxID=602034 RepID=A0A8H8RE53_9HELO|nr:hypothetical protein LSUB1_G007201 [Lachnellula subtilissima]